MERVKLIPNQELRTEKFHLSKPFIFISVLLLIIISNTQNAQAQWLEYDKIVASNRMTLDQFGFDIKTNNNLVVVGAPNRGFPGAADAGAVYVYEKTDTEYVQLQILSANDLNTGDNFGHSVSISETGEYIIVGAPKQDTDENGQNPLTDSGAAYIFKRNLLTGEWKQFQKIVAKDESGNSKRQNGARFGFDVDLTDSPYVRRAIVGAVYESENISGPASLLKVGAAYIFDGDGGGKWTASQRLTASDRKANDNFGFSVAIARFKAVVGAIGNDYDGNGQNYIAGSGSAYVFEVGVSARSINDYYQTDKLTSTDRGASELFGFEVGIYGNIPQAVFRIVVGAPYDDEGQFGQPAIHNAGSAFIFFSSQYGGNNNWFMDQKLVANDRSVGDHYGTSVAIAETYAMVGATDNDKDANGMNILNDSGAGYIYKAGNSPYPSGWIFDEKIVASDRESKDHFGYSVDIDVVGNHCVVGVRDEGHDDAPIPGNYLPSAGSAYIFELDIPAPLISDGSKKTSTTLSQFAVIPNPSNGQFEINISNFDPSETYLLTIRDISGKKIMEEAILNFKHYVNLETQANGVYIITLNDGKQLSHAKIIKSN